LRSVDKLAVLAELSPTYVRRIAGKTPPNVRLQTLRSLADVLQVPVWALFEHAPTCVDEKKATQQLPLPMIEA
jgi:transcriptional regulator with XRE-family HTH domain